MAPAAAAPPLAALTPPLRPDLCTVIPRAPSDSLAIVWSDHSFASAFWIVDQLSAWNGERRNAYIPWWREHYPSDLEDSAPFRDYAILRKTHSAEKDSPPDLKHPESVLPPEPSPADTFAAAAFCSQGPREAAAALGLSAEETRAFVAPFEKLGAHIDEVLRDATYLPTARQRLRALATKADMGGFLAKAARFYGTSATVQSPLYIDVLWAPPHNMWATTMGNHMIVPISEKVGADDKRLSSWLGVVVHEFGHYLEGRLPAEEKATLSDRIVGTGGLLRAGHTNIIDEATATALGNMVFLKTRLPEGYSDENLYTFEVDERYPDAIDSLARAVQPDLARLLDTAGAFSGDYLTAALLEQSRTFPARLDHFAPVALFYTSNPSARASFDGLFFGRSRWSFDDAAEFAGASNEGRTISRWLLTTSADLGARHDLPSVAAMPMVSEVAATVTATKARGCVGARRRASGLGMDVAVVGSDPAGLRQTLIAISRGMTVPGRKPLCVH